MSSLKEQTKKIILNTLKQVSPAGRWKVLVVDPATLSLLNACCKMPEILNENVTVVEALLRKRQPNDEMVIEIANRQEAIYLISANIESVNALLEDFAKRPAYKACHIFTVSSLPDSLFSKIKHGKIKPYIKCLKELNLDFLPLDNVSFSLENYDAWYDIYNPDDPTLLQYELKTIAKRIASVMVTLGENPIIRHHNRPALFATNAQKSICGDLASILKSELDKICKKDPSFPPHSNNDRATLLIVDRSIDVLSPLLHEFSYQAMATDLIGLNNGKYKDEKLEEHHLDDSDQVWELTKTWHIAKVLEYIPEQMRQFVHQNKAAQYELSGGGEGGSSLDKIEVIKGAVASMGEYQDLKSKYAKHTELCTRIIQIYNQRNLESVSMASQDQVMTPFDAPESRKKQLWTELLKIFKDPDIEHADKFRLLIIYIISREGVSDSELKELMDAAHVSQSEQQALNNLAFLSVKLSPSSSADKMRNSKNPFCLSKNIARTSHYSPEFENSRFEPTIGFILQDLLDDKLDSGWFPELNGGESRISYPKTTSCEGRSGSVPEEHAVRKAKPSWATKKKTSAPVSESEDVAPKKIENISEGARVIIFCLGGITASEIVEVQKLRENTNRPIIIGSTHVWQPDQFVESLKYFSKQGSRGKDFKNFVRKSYGRHKEKEVVAISDRLIDQLTQIGQYASTYMNSNAGNLEKPTQHISGDGPSRSRKESPSSSRSHHGSSPPSSRSHRGSSSPSSRSHRGSSSPSSRSREPGSSRSRSERDADVSGSSSSNSRIRRDDNKHLSSSSRRGESGSSSRSYKPNQELNALSSSVRDMRVGSGRSSREKQPEPVKEKKSWFGF